MTEIVLVDCDDWQALYIDGDLHDWTEHYNLDFKYGFRIAMAHPGATLRRVEVDQDWLWDEHNGDMPMDLSEVKLI
jgi:hypothetical protein